MNNLLNKEKNLSKISCKYRWGKPNSKVNCYGYYLEEKHD